MARDHPKRLK